MEVFPPVSLSQTTWLLSPETAVASVGLSGDALHTQADMYRWNLEFVCIFLCYHAALFHLLDYLGKPVCIAKALPCWRLHFAAGKVLSQGCSTHHFSIAQFFSGLHSGPLEMCTPMGPEPLSAASERPSFLLSSQDGCADVTITPVCLRTQAETRWWSARLAGTRPWQRQECT